MDEEFTGGQERPRDGFSGAKTGTGGASEGSTPLPPVLVSVPFSKSILQRSLLAAAWVGGQTTLTFPTDPGPPGSQGADVADLILALGALGLAIRPGAGPASGECLWRLSAPGFSRLGNITLALGESGTAARFCTAALAFAGIPGSIRSVAVSGSMLERRSDALIASLRAAGCEVQSAGPGTWPVGFNGVSMPRELRLEHASSSQEVSALLFALAFQGGGQLTVQGPIPSRPYVSMTRAVLDSFGVGIEQVSDGDCITFILSPELAGEQAEGSRALTVEADASAAAVAWSAGLICSRPVEVAQVVRHGMQGDARILDLLKASGAELTSPRAHSWRVQATLTKGWQADLSDTPDLAPPLVALAACLALGHFGTRQASRFTGLGTLQGKESPRLTVLCEALNRIGIAAQSGADWLEIPVGQAVTDPVELSTCGDHRMAFAFGLLALAVPSIRVLGRDCVGKSWPTFWADLHLIRGAPAQKIAPK